MSKYLRTPQRKLDPLSRIFTLGEITNESANEILGLIHEVNREDSVKLPEDKVPIKLIINSPGGSVYDGMAVIDAIETSLTPIHTYVYGHAMSMAFAIASCGHYRYASKRATFMYHEMSWGTEREKMKYHEQEVKEGKRFWKLYDSVVVSHSKIKLLSLEAVRKESKEWYITPDQALKLGLIDEII